MADEADYQAGDRTSLSFEDGRWFMHYSFPADPTAPHSLIETERLPLDGDTINRVLDAVAAHA